MKVSSNCQAELAELFVFPDNLIQICQTGGSCPEAPNGRRVPQVDPVALQELALRQHFRLLWRRPRRRGRLAELRTAPPRACPFRSIKRLRTITISKKDAVFNRFFEGR